MTIPSGKICIGIGGRNFEPWRGLFYPKGLAQSKELAYAASHLTSIEINATFYGSQKPESFRKWAAAVPHGFVFSVKGPRFATNRRVLAEAGDSIKRFLNSGVLELGDGLGPLLWQFAPTKKFDAADFGKFLELLPTKAEGRRLRHAVEVRHASFLTPDFVALARSFGTPIVFTDHATYPSLADATGDFIYARLQKGKDTIPTAYPPRELDAWAKRPWQSSLFYEYTPFCNGPDEVTSFNINAPTCPHEGSHDSFLPRNLSNVAKDVAKNLNNTRPQNR